MTQAAKTALEHYHARMQRVLDHIERNLDDIDGSHNAGAEAAGLEKENSFGFRCIAAFVNGGVVKCGCSHAYQYTAYGGLSG